MKKQNEEDIFLSNVRHIHMIGIGGSGMCPIAEILNSKGYIITGSDNNESDPLKRVRKFAKVYLGHDKKNIEGAQLVIYSAAISKENVELVAAKENNIPTMQRSHVLGALTRLYDNVIGVCGTHGKTTVTSLLTQIFIQNDKDPSAIIGGKLPLIDHYGIVGKSDNLIVESCEFVDTFLQESEDIAILLNIDNDHLDYFKTMDNLVASFHKFVSKAKLVFVNNDDQLAKKAIEGIEGQIITFGFDDKADYYPTNITKGKYGYKFEVNYHHRSLGQVELSIPGRHNIYNGLVSFALGHYSGIEPQGIIESIKQFKGAARRFEFIGDYGFMLADDYGHHPTEIKATLKAAKELDYQRLIVIFQPFTYTRTKSLLDDFVDALSVADETILTPIMGSRETDTLGISSYDLCCKMEHCQVISTFEEIVQYVINNYHKGDLVITMGCGDVYKIAHLISEHFGS